MVARRAIGISCGWESKLVQCYAEGMPLRVQAVAPLGEPLAPAGVLPGEPFAPAGTVWSPLGTLRPRRILDFQSRGSLAVLSGTPRRMHVVL